MPCTVMETSVELLNARCAVLDYLRAELVGPRSGDCEELMEEPHRRYTAGILYPQESYSDAMTGEEEGDATGVVGASGPSDSFENQGDDPIALANQYLPSSMGISFSIQGEPAVDVEVTGGYYEEVTGASGGRRTSRRWLRHPLALEPLRLELGPQHEDWVCRVERKILHGAARVHSVWRRGDGEWLVTVTLINERRHAGHGLPPGADCLCQAGFRCRASGIRIC